MVSGNKHTDENNPKLLYVTAQRMLMYTRNGYIPKRTWRRADVAVI